MQFDQYNHGFSNKVVGDKRYELTNHLGNVLSVISDKKLITQDVDDKTDFISLFRPDVLAYNDYYPFGMLVPNRHQNTPDYRYGFNGMELDNEIKGEGNSYDFGARMFDPRVGRWFTTDKVMKPWLSQYQFVSNNPVNNLDPNGNDEIHFFYRLLPFTDGEGKTTQRLVLSAEIIENDLEHTFFMHSSTGVATQFHPFKSDRTPNQTSYEAYRDNLPLSSSSRSILGFEVYKGSIDDYTYLGKLLQLAPEVMEHYKNAKDGTGTRIHHSIKMAGSVDFYEKLVVGTRVAYAIDGAYAITRGLSSFIVRGLDKNINKVTTNISKAGTEAAKKTENLVRITGVEDDVMMFSAKIGNETVEGIANFAVKDGKLFLNQLHLQGSSAGNVGMGSLFKMAKDLGKQHNVKEVIIQGGKRTTGKYKGEVPTPITIKVD